MRVTREQVDTFVPEHGRTSCADDHIINGFGSADYGPRCTRCALLEAVEDGGEVPEEFEVSVTLHKKTW